MNKTDLAKALEIDPEIQRSLGELYSRAPIEVGDCLTVIERMAQQKAVLKIDPEPFHLKYVTNRFDAMIQMSRYGCGIDYDDLWKRYHEARETLGYGHGRMLEGLDRGKRKPYKGLRAKRARHRDFIGRITLGGTAD